MISCQESKPLGAELLHALLVDHLANTMNIQVDIDYAVHLLDRLIEKTKTESAIEENKNWLTTLVPAMDENVVYNSDFHDRIKELEKVKV